MTQYNLDEYCPECRCYMVPKAGGWRVCATAGCSKNPERGSDAARRAPLTVADCMEVPEVRALVLAAQCCIAYRTGHDSTLPVALAPFLAAMKVKP